ncbi:DNA alkylation repair protein [Halobacillus litoralis]|uniref:DNA alkylation repair protein n=1 Tax=Halobacillus litoralis TaxID=45668 RepID=UPI001CFE1377|nr:DNA alkylation repair protein [Halobacillus litoralis]
MSRVSDFVEEVDQTLAANQNEENQKQMEAYMKNHFSFYGIKSPERKQILAPILKEYRNITEEERLEASLELFQKPARECQYAALALLEKGKKKTPEHAIDVYKELLMTKSWWDTVDMIASHLCGAYFQKYPDKLHPYTEEWRHHDDMWVRRSSVLHQLKYKGDTDEKLLFETITVLKDEKEFFIEKAIGWALREYSKTNPTAVIEFLERTDCRPLSRREGLKWLKNKHPELLQLT